MKLFQEGKPVYRANFHLHTTRSDGRQSPEDAAALLDGLGRCVPSAQRIGVVKEYTGGKRILLR